MSFIEQFNYNRDLIAGKSSDPDHGYSLFNLNGDPNQYVVDVVDVSTNTTGSYTATDLKDGTLEADIINIGVVSKFYDQFGGKHATGINTGKMPYIITGGSFVELNNKPAMIFRSGSRNAYLLIKNEGYDNIEPGNLSSHILGIDGLETFTIASLDDDAKEIYQYNTYGASYIFGENYNGGKKDFGVGFTYTGSSNRFYLYTERGDSNFFSGFSIAEDNDANQHGFGYTGEEVNLGQRYIINAFAGFDSINSSGMVGLGDGQNYISGYVATGRDNYIVGTIGSDETYDKTFTGKLQEALFYTSLRDDRATIYSEIQDRLGRDLDYLASSVSPIYGSSITFSASNSSWRGSNYYQFVMPNGLNSIKAEMDLTFQGNKKNMKSLLRRIQNATTGTITGDVAFSGTEDCINFGEFKHGVQIDLDTDYYQNFSGSQISNYNLKHISSDVYELNVSMFNDRVSPILSNGMGFVADRTVDIYSSPFEKFDVIGREVTGFTLDGVSGTDGSHVTGDWLWVPSIRQGQRLVDSNDLIFESSNRFQISDNDFNPYIYTDQLNVDYPWSVTSWTVVIGNSSNLPVFSNFKYKKYNNNSFDDYFYLTDDRSSAVTASNISGLATYTGIADDATRTFFWEPDQQVSLPVDHSARINDFKRSFTQQLNISRNQNRIDALDLTFTNRSEKETYSILHFLETHLGYKQFVYYYDDDIIQQNRVFFCPQWKHTFNYKDSNTIEARFIEIVAPVTPEF
jgi:phage-related protein